ncbi:MAG: NUDIX domain-containing protein [Candidatus Melainabacteria bacterium]
MALHPYDEDFTVTRAHLQEKTMKQHRLQEGRVISMRRDDALLPDGKPCTREVIEHPGGVVILPILPDGRLILVEQWRYALNRTLIEAPAGKLDPGEAANPIEAARRELLEETGYRTGHIREMTSIFTSPGFCDERLWIYLASDLTAVDNHDDHKMDDEFIDMHHVTPEEAMAWVREGRIVDAKTITALWFLLADGR